MIYILSGSCLKIYQQNLFKCVECQDDQELQHVKDCQGWGSDDYTTKYSLFFTFVYYRDFP